MSNPNDIILDAFCRCGTALIAAKAIPHFEFENWAVIALGGVPNKVQMGHMGIDGRICPVGTRPAEAAAKGKTGQTDHMFADDWFPIQVKPMDKVGRPDIDQFEAVMERENPQRGFFVAFGYSSDAENECAGFYNRTGRIISCSPYRRFWTRSTCRRCEGRRRMADNDSHVNLLKWLLQVDIRWKNGVSALVALLSVSVVYFAGHDRDWFREIADRGNGPIAAALTAVLLTSFLSSWLVLSAAVGLWQRHRSTKLTRAREFDELLQIRNTLGSLTDWQRSFLLRFIVNDTMQITEWEVGRYEAVWGPEVEVLRAKGIIVRHFSGVLEITPQYWQFLKAFWDPETRTLKFPGDSG